MTTRVTAAQQDEDQPQMFSRITGFVRRHTLSDRQGVALQERTLMNGAHAVKLKGRRRRSRTVAVVAASTVAALTASACHTVTTGKHPSAPGSSSAAGVSAELQKLMRGAPWSSGQWGLQVTDLKSGKVVQSKNATSKFVTGSTAKTFAVGAALDTLGSSHRFRTPLVRSGSVSHDGRLSGNLIMVGSGDLTLGGRTNALGKVDIPDFDHTDANAVPGMATLTREDPLAGINDLARQVAASGIRHIDGDVVIDDRLWAPVTIGGTPITPTVVNDNLIDLLITPAAPGRQATVDWRPKTAAFTVDSRVTTTPAGTKPAVKTDSPAAGRIRIGGSVPADAAAPFIATYQVPDPAAFARTVLIEALAKHGVSVASPTLGDNPSSKLPPVQKVKRLPVSASYTSPPFKEYAKLINKVSHNLGANLLPPLMAVHNGKHTYADGMKTEREFLTRAGIDRDSFDLVDAQGLTRDRATPAAQTQLLRNLSGKNYFGVLHDSMPTMGVDGSLAGVIKPTDPAAGHIRAKTGTLIGAVNGKLALTTKALAGYVDAENGRRYAFAIYVNDIPAPGNTVNGAIDLALKANKQLGAMAASIYRNPNP
ncbi:D-alanyl-D-alanine carboxypeptidase/D-alanyl-D-alanine-endopeptidase [Streptomyces sp. NBC_00440]|uniref:D-alanyl-D-alanine carboxypeptidase/D-alanyl-D-alanine endopeptidase n=1 Tax=Streptomyces sp. NBC_00440 TaxID=2975741 RepID=UPI002E2226ED